MGRSDIETLRQGMKTGLGPFFTIYPSLPEANLVNERSSFFYRVSSRAACLQINLKFLSMNFPETVAESLDNSGEDILYIIGSSETMSDAVQGLNELALAVKCKNKHRR